MGLSISIFSVIVSFNAFCRLLFLACIHSACLACCSDLQCKGHREARENAQWKEAVLTGTTDIHIKAKSKRASAVLPGSFREPGFLYLNQTITLWDRNKFMKNKKWKEDAIRRSEKRKARNDSSSIPVVGNSRKRFRTVMENLYRKSHLDDGALDMFEEETESARVS
jgi:hypothetical protein